MQKRRENQHRMRERILDAAAVLVREDGMAAATTKRIALKAEVSEGSLYNHFPDKAELLIAIVLERMPSIRDALQSLGTAAETSSLEDRLEKVLTAMIGFYVQAQPILGGIMADPRLLALCRERFAETGRGPHLAHQKLAELLGHEVAAGRLRGDVDVAALAALLIGACTDYATMITVAGRPASTASETEYVRAIVSTLRPLLT